MPQDINDIKPNDLPSIKNRISHLKSFTEKLHKLRDSVSEDNEATFTKSGKLKTGQECAHTFNEKCLGMLKSLDTKIQDCLKTMQNTEAKCTRMYPLASTSTTSRKRRQKENKNKAKRRKSEREKKNCERIFSLVTRNCVYGNQIVDPALLNKDAISDLGKKDIHYLKLLFNKNMFNTQTVKVCSTLNQLLLAESSSDESDESSDY